MNGHAIATALRASAIALEAQAKALRLEAEALDEADAKAAPDGAVFVTIKALAAHFGVTRRTVFAWLADGLPSLKRGRFRRVSVEAATAWLAARGA